MNPEGWTAQSVLSRVRNGDVATREVARSVANRAGRSLIELINEALACERLPAQLELSSARRFGELPKEVSDNTKEEQHEPITEMDWHTEKLDHDRKQENMQIVGIVGLEKSWASEEQFQEERDSSGTRTRVRRRRRAPTTSRRSRSRPEKGRGRNTARSLGHAT